MDSMLLTIFIILLIILGWYMIWVFFLKEIPFCYDVIRGNDKENEAKLYKKWKHKIVDET